MKQIITTLLLATASMVAQGAPQNNGQQVYASAHGTKYHTHKDCQYIKGRDNVQTITLAKAQSKDMEKCKRCEGKDNKTKKEVKK